MRVIVNPKGYEIDGVLYPRVTRILGNLPKPALVPWAAKCVAEFAVEHQQSWMHLPPAAAIRMLKTEPIQQRDDAAAAGTAVHKAIEASVKGADVAAPTDERTSRIFKGAMQFFEDYQPTVLGSEVTVFSNEPELYAGTLDLHCLIEGEPYICDFKTSKGVYPDMALQLGLYRRAEWAIRMNEKVPWFGRMPDVESPKLAIIHLTPDGYVFYDVTADAVLMLDVSNALFQIDKWQQSNATAIKARPRPFNAEAALQKALKSAARVDAAQAEKDAGWLSL